MAEELKLVNSIFEVEWFFLARYTRVLEMDHWNDDDDDDVKYWS